MLFVVRIKVAFGGGRFDVSNPKRGSEGSRMLLDSVYWERRRKEKEKEDRIEEKRRRKRKEEEEKTIN